MESSLLHPETQTPLRQVKYFSINHAEKYWIGRARNNVADYITYLTDGAMSPAEHHLQWLYEIFIAKEKFVNLVAFRGSGKTSILVKALSYIIGKKPWLTNFIGSVSFEQAKDRLQEVREIIEINQRYKNVFPWLQMDDKRANNMRQFTVWSTMWKNGVMGLDYSQWRGLIARYGQPKGHTLMASGMTAKGIPGNRFTGLVLLDDPHDESNSANEEQRVKVDNIFKRTLLPCIVPESDAKAVVISTRWAETDLAGRLKDEKRKNGNFVWKTIEVAVRKEDGKPTWPEVWGEEEIEERHEEVGDVMFELMYNNNPFGMSLGEFTLDMLKKSLPHIDELKDKLKEVIISVDLSFSNSIKADFTVFSAIGRDNEKHFNIYVLDIVRGKFKKDRKGTITPTLERLSDFADEIYERYGRVDKILFHHIGDETNWADELKFTHGEVAFVETVKTKGDKDTRLNYVAVKAQQGRMFVNTKMKNYPIMCSELVSFPMGKHDDICDTLSLPFQLKSWKPRQNRSGTEKIQSPFLL